MGNSNELVFKEKIESLQAQILERKVIIHNEENTKQSLINPFLMLLGYDVHNPKEIEFEYGASFSYKNSDRVDYAIKVNDKPIFFIEAKKVDEDLTIHRSQLEYYLSSNNDVKVGVLTNGIRYEFYSYFERNKSMDKEPFFIFDFENLEDEKIENLQLFCKQEFNLAVFLKKGEELWYYTKITQRLIDILRKPTDEFIRFLAKDYSSSKITSVALEKFRPIVNKSITTAITDLTQETLINEESLSQKNKTIITTKEELSALELVKTILTKANKDISNINYKDTVSYFGIYNRNVNGWFVRFVLDQQPTLVMIRLEYSKAKEIPSDLKLQPLNSKGITKIFIESLKDIDKLEPFILKAFEVIE